MWSVRSRKLRWSSRARDRKSTRLNSSHGYISYAVFCLKKKKNHLSLVLFILLCLGTVALASRHNGSIGQISASYDTKIFTINFHVMAAISATELHCRSH